MRHQLTPAQIERLRAEVAAATTVEEVIAAIGEALQDPHGAVSEALACTAVADAGLVVLLALQSYSTPIPWLENPAFAPWRPLMARAWAHAMTVNTPLCDQANGPPYQGLHWLSTHGHIEDIPLAARALAASPTPPPYQLTEPAPFPPDVLQALRQQAAAATSVADIAELILLGPGNARMRFKAIAPFVGVADASLALACIQQRAPQWDPATWLANPAYARWHALAAQAWVTILLSGTADTTDAASAFQGLRGLLDYGHGAVVTPHLASLQAYVCRGQSPCPAPSRLYAYQTLVAASAIGEWSPVGLVRWRTVLPGGFQSGPESGEALLRNAAVPVDMVRTLITPGLVQDDRNACRALVRRNDVRRDPECRQRLRDATSAQHGVEDGYHAIEFWRLIADVADDFDQVVLPYVRAPQSSMPVRHDDLALAFVVNPEGVAERLGPARMAELAHSPSSALRAQVALNQHTRSRPDIGEVRRTNPSAR